MKNYLILIKAKGNPIHSLSEEEQQVHIQKVGGFIEGLASSGNLNDAQPLEMAGVVLSNKSGAFSEQSIDAKQEVNVGYYLIKANDLNEATAIAKSDPRFNDGEWKMEIRPIMSIEGIN